MQFLATITLTAISWLLGPLVWEWWDKQPILPVMIVFLVFHLLMAVLAPFRRLILSFPPRLFVLLLTCVGVCVLGGWLAWLPGICQFCIGLLCLIPVGFFGLSPKMFREEEEPKYPEPVPEQLRRYPLIRGLMRAVMAGETPTEPVGGHIGRIKSKAINTKINRIALCGPWGCGKTLILDHVAYALNDKKLARAVKVAPWGCATVADARACLAEGMRSLLREKTFQQIPILKALVKAFGVSDTVDAVFELVGGDRESGLKALDKLLAKEEESSKRRMILVIDDMERAEPFILRALLPLLSELIELKHCTFLIAIDADHFKLAFSETDSPEGNEGQAKECNDTAEGFMQKVFDLRIDMPSTAPQDRIEALSRLQLGLDKEGDDLVQPHLAADFRVATIENSYPKLASVLPRLYSSLPTNPRDLDRFLTKARLYEACFLGDYGGDEHQWELFFQIWLIDTCFPGFAKALKEAAKGTGFYVLGMSTSTDEFRQQLKENGFVVRSEKAFVAALTAFIGMKPHLYFQIGWFIEGFLCPPSLSHKLRQRLQQRWSCCPTDGLSNLVRDTFDGTEAPDVLGAISDLLQYLVKRPLELLRKAHSIKTNRDELDQMREDLRQHLETMNRSLNAWKAKPTDQAYLAQIVTVEYVKEWIGLSMMTLSVTGFEQFFQPTRELILTIALLSSSECQMRLADMDEWSQESYRREQNESLGKDLRAICRSNVRSTVWRLFKSGAPLPSFISSDMEFAILAEPSFYFPEGSDERVELGQALQEPSNVVSSALYGLWGRVTSLLERTRGAGNHIPDLSSNSDYWLMLWKAFKEHNHPDLVKHAAKILTESPEKPEGLNKVRDQLPANP